MSEPILYRQATEKDIIEGTYGIVYEPMVPVEPPDDRQDWRLAWVVQYPEGQEVAWVEVTDE